MISRAGQENPHDAAAKADATANSLDELLTQLEDAPWNDYLIKPDQSEGYGRINLEELPKEQQHDFEKLWSRSKLNEARKERLRQLQNES